MQEVRVGEEQSNRETEEADYGHLVLRLLAGLVLFSTARFCLQAG